MLEKVVGKSGYSSRISVLVGEVGEVGVESFEELSVVSLQRVCDWLDYLSLAAAAAVTAPVNDKDFAPVGAGSPLRHAFMMGKIAALNELTEMVHNQMVKLNEEEVE